MIHETIALMGLPATDKVSGLQGTITSVAFDLYGCVQVTLSPKAKKDGEVVAGYWMDINRVTVGKGKDRVMPVPDFDGATGYDKGPAKPETYTKGAAEKRPL